MHIKNSQIRAKARQLLDENIFGKDWLKSVFLQLLMALICGGVIALFTGLLNRLIFPLLLMWIPQESILLYIMSFLIILVEVVVSCVFIGPLNVGMASVHLDLVRGDGNIKISKFFDGFKEFVDNFLLGAMYVIQVTLWSLLFIIPGIYVSLSYVLAFHVRKDHPEYRWQQCFDESERLMEGNRWRYLKLQFSFIGWMFLSALVTFPLGWGDFWVLPYMQVSDAVFYEEVKKEKDSNIVSFETAPKKTPDQVVVDLKK